MKISRKKLEEIIHEEFKNLLFETKNKKQDIINIIHNNILKDIRASILVALDMIELNRKDTNFKFTDKQVIEFGINRIRMSINQSHPDILSSITADIKEILKQIKIEIETSSPEKIKDFQSISDEYIKLADEYKKYNFNYN